MSEEPEKQYGVPRRFGIGTILVVTAAFAMLFALLMSLGASPTVVAFFSGLVFVVGVGQLWLFGGKNPRAASAWVGVVGLPTFSILRLSYSYVANWESPPQIMALLLLIVSLPMGALMGYLAGGMVAGVFLIMDAVEKTFFSPVGKFIDEETAPKAVDPLAED